MEWKGMWTKLR